MLIWPTCILLALVWPVSLSFLKLGSYTHHFCTDASKTCCGCNQHDIEALWRGARKDMDHGEYELAGQTQGDTGHAERPRVEEPMTYDAGGRNSMEGR